MAAEIDVTPRDLLNGLLNRLLNWGGDINFRSHCRRGDETEKVEEDDSGSDAALISPGYVI